MVAETSGKLGKRNDEHKEVRKIDEAIRTHGRLLC